MALELDRLAGNKAWLDVIQREIATLIQLGCFEFKTPGYKPTRDYQYAPLRMVFDVKADLRRKARLVAGGHVIDASCFYTHSTVVKGVSIRLLHVIAHRDGLRILVGDVGNAFINAKTLEKVYTRAGPEFGDREGCILILCKALYGLKTSGAQWHAYFADFL